MDIDMEELSGESSENTTQIKPNTGARRIFPRWQCPICGTRTWITNKKRHLDTKKHKEVLYITTERFEMSQ
jgi:rRNA maturation endonuclease Nob1